MLGAVNNSAHQLQLENSEAIAINSQTANNNKMQHRIASLKSKFKVLTLKIKHPKMFIRKRTKSKPIEFFRANVKGSP